MNSKTSKLSRLHCKESKIISGNSISSRTESEKESKRIVTIKTPVSRRTIKREDFEDDFLSSFSIQFTQDSVDDNTDVVWEWESPQSKNNHLHRKRMIHSSPNIPKKQLSCMKGIPMFGSLKSELEEFRNKLDEPSSEYNSYNQSCLVFEDDGVCMKLENPASTVDSKENSDLFDDDSLDAEMFKCSQKIEMALFDSCSLGNNAYNIKSVTKVENELITNNQINDDSFDVFLEKINDEQIELLSQGSTSPIISSLSQSSAVKQANTITTQSPRSIARTNSVPTDFLLNKRPVTSTSSSNVFPRTKSEDLNNVFKVKCSPDEIEKKRQEAKAKLEWRRKQNEIEKKRLEALERLKRNRLQRMLNKQNGASIGSDRPLQRLV